MPVAFWLKANPPKAQGRISVMAQCSLDFHVLSTLWMLEVGHLFDVQLTDCAYGNRLRRTQDGKGINALAGLISAVPEAFPRLA